jgi:cytochrome P450 / NADPH-cytochrome P450 reductase
MERIAVLFRSRPGGKPNPVKGFYTALAVFLPLIVLIALRRSPKPVVGKRSIMTLHPFQTIPLCPIKRLAEEPTPIQSLMKWAQEYGPIFQLDAPGPAQLIISRFSLVDEVSDDTRFDKQVAGSLHTLRALVGDGLFTAFTQEPNWGKAHRILLPNFSQKAMQGYFPMMLDLAEQLIDKWKRLNRDDEVDVVADMTRLTLDTIGICGFDYRFNSFYRQDMHPFVQSLIRLLTWAQQQRFQPSQSEAIAQQEVQQDVNFMNTMVDNIIRERKARADGEATPQDLLSYMLAGVDKETGEKLDDVNIRYQIITFLIAGHETTSGLLSFAFFLLLQHPEVLAKAYAEVDRVLGGDLTKQPTYAQIMQLKYVGQILKETLRLWPTAPAFARMPYEDTVIGGMYHIARDTSIMTAIPALHRDSTIWGDHPEQFDPEHFRPEAEQARPANAYKPFGTGSRACIGRQFALQEATLVLGMVLQHFKLIDSTHAPLKVKQTLTLKPSDLHMQVRSRPPVHVKDQPAQLTPSMHVATEETTTTTVRGAAQHHTPLRVLFGSNMGTSEGIAQQIADDGTARGFAVTLAPLDSATQNLPTDGAVVIVTSSYNGTPPDNAVHFCTWLTTGQMSSADLKGVNYTVMGCGNRDWASTFQKVPRLIDGSLET